ncbi:hypothetical protein VNI00_006231 [Paramarasmius palmivorus]|uniref:Uncharacterized protein n=1 Tax=Paramarasmius palmivorus TaxID=297713 RepID=A0AAW0D5P0_9AGAR
MSSIAHHGSESVNFELAKEVPTLLRLLDEFSDDPIVAELTISVMSHTLGDVMRKRETLGVYTPYIPPYLQIRPLLDAVMKQLKNPHSSAFLVNHAICLLAVMTYHCGPTVKADQSITNFLIAGLRSKSWEYRCQCLGGLIRMHRYAAKEDVRFFDPSIYLKMTGREVPDHIADVLSGYGRDRTDMFITSKAMFQNQVALQKMLASRDKDRIYPYGLCVSELILETEWAVTDGWLEGPDTRTGQFKEAVYGFPFNRLRDALPHCAALIRANGIPSEVDKADTLDIKYLIMIGDNTGAAELAYEALQRNPNFAYYYYAISLLGDRKEGLRGAKKGLKCTQTSPFVRNQLRQRAVEHAADLGMGAINEAGDHRNLWEEGIALLMSALEDSKTFIKEAAPDNRQMRNVLYWNILLTILIRGPDASSDLSDVQNSLKKLKFTDDFAEYMKQPPPQTQLRLTQETFVKNYQSAIAEWGDIIENYQGFQEETVEPNAKTDDDLAAWLDDMKLDDGEKEPTCSHPKVNVNHVALYQYIATLGAKRRIGLRIRSSAKLLPLSLKTLVLSLRNS